MAKLGFLAVLAAGCWCWLGGAGSASAQNPPTMRLDPPSVKIQGVVGAAFTVYVRIEGVTDLGGFTFEIHYDESSLDLVDIREGPFLGSGGGSTICVEAGPPTFQGLGRLSCIVLGKQGAPSGSGVVGELDFSLEIPFSVPGQLQLLLMGCDAADSQGNPIVLTGCKDGIVDINPAPTATPTRTPTPTPRPVGGVSLDADAGARPAAGTQPSKSSAFLWAGVLAGGMGGVAALGATAWHARRRQSR